MNAVTPTTPETEVETGAIVALEGKTPLQILTDEAEQDAFIKRVREAVTGQPQDVTTAKGRKEIASQAYKVAQTSAGLNKARLALTADWRKQTEAANAAGKKLTEQLEALKLEVRKPLTDWEAAEEARANDVKAKIERIQAAATVTLEDTVESVQLRLQEVGGIEITDEHFQEHAAPARALLDRTLDTLRAAVARLQREAEERAELERLRQEAAARQAQEQAEREAREAQEAEAKRRRDHALAIMQHIRDCGAGTIGGQAYPYVILIRELEEKVVIDDTFGDLEADARQLLADTLTRLKADMQREAEEAQARAAQEQAQREQEAAERARLAAEQAAREAEQRARDEERQKAEAEQKAAAARSVIERMKAAAVIAVDDTVATLQRRLDEVEGAEITADAFGDLVDEARAQKQAAIKALTEAGIRLNAEAEERRRADARQKDREHRGSVMAAVKGALMGAGGIGEEAAKKIVLAIVAGEIPHTSIQF